MINPKREILRTTPHTLRTLMNKDRATPIFIWREVHEKKIQVTFSIVRFMIYGKFNARIALMD